MKQAKMTVDREYAIGGVDRYLFGSFIEMYFNVVNGGIYDPNSPTADEMGFRRDVLDLVRELKVPIVRFPGGCTVSDYFWEDGVGPAESRIPRHNLVTGKTESNRFGTNEFFEWAKKAETDIFMVVNLATRTPRDAANHVEYCNHPGGSYYSDLRKSHGYANPHNIKIWGLDNEVDGPWSVGHKSADEYGRIAFLASSLMKRVDGSIKTVLCGSSGYGMPSFPQWDATVLEHCYDTADYISAHIYYDIKEGDSASYLASTMSMDRYIKDLAATCDYVKAKKRSKRKIYISFDEWNVWFQHRWQEIRSKGEFSGHDHNRNHIKMEYNLEDAVVVGSMLNCLIRNADRVKIGGQAQLVNMLAPIVVDGDGIARRRLIFYPYLHASLYGGGVSLLPVVDSPKYDSAEYTDIPVLDAAVTHDEPNASLTVFAVNRDLDDQLRVEADLRQFLGYSVIEHISLCGDDRKAFNDYEDEYNIVPQSLENAFMENGKLITVLPKHSWNVIRLCKTI